MLSYRKVMGPFNSMKKDSDLIEGSKIGNEKFIIFYKSSQRNYILKKWQ